MPGWAIVSLLSCFPHSSATVCCSCSAPASLGCSTASKSGLLPPCSTPSGPSSCPGRSAKAPGPRRRWHSAPPPSSSSSPAMTFVSWTWPPKLGTPPTLTASRWGRCDPSKSPLTFWDVGGPRPVKTVRRALSSPDGVVWRPLVTSAVV